MLVDPFLPYVAGFFDGEGSVGIYGRGRNGTYSLTVSINQLISPASTQLFLECQVRWAGRLSTYRPGTRDACSWSLPGQKAYDFLVEMRPWVPPYFWRCAEHKLVPLDVSWSGGRPKW